jgi:release factor glutamine methyltransferase
LSSARDLIRAAAARIDRLDAEVLAAHVAGVSRADMLLHGLDRPLDAPAYQALADRRAAREPLAYIVGHREFWSIEFRVTPDVLIPRADSELLIERALRAPPPRRVLDLGTGSGCLLLALLSARAEATGVGVDRSEAALAVAADNAARLGLADRAAFRAGDWAAGIDERFDVVLANPPYVEAGAELMPEVAAHEPASALFAGPDGLDDYRRIVPDLPRLLTPGGAAFLEIGLTQADAVEALGRAAGLATVRFADLGGRDRCVEMRRPR